ncbi:MAG TPA: rhodanese-like domain-containing protein [Labilithrix sp.]
MDHSPRFLKLCEDVRKRVRETSIDAIAERVKRGEKLELVDVREESEYAKEHIPGARHLGKGVIERDIEKAIPNPDQEIVLYCGGGFRSALAAENLGRMGYTNVWSMDGGWRGWTAKGLPTEK